MPARSISTASITFGLVSIPVRLFPAGNSKTVRFNLLHAKDNSRIQERIYCPADDKIVDRSELIRGYEIEKGRYVTFTDEELKKLEAAADHAIEISEFIPVKEVDPVYFNNSYFLGCEPTSAKAYHLLNEAMTKMGRVGLAKITMRGKEHLALIRPYEDGLMLHTMYFADEIRSFRDIDHGVKAPVQESELKLAERLLEDLSQKKFQPEKYKDSYRDRVIEAAEQKLAGHEVAETATEAPRGKVIDLMGALKASLKKRGIEVNADNAEEGARRAAQSGIDKEERESAKSAPRPRARRSAR